MLPTDRAAPSARKALTSRLTGFALAAALALVVWPAPLAAQSGELSANLPSDGQDILGEFEPTEGQSKATLYLARQLERNHYLRLAVDDELSERVFDRYLDFIDPARAYLLASDVASFEPWRDELDDRLLRGDLGPGFEIFNRYFERQLVRMQDVLELLEEDLEELPFGPDQTLDFDRTEVPWATTTEELDEFWMKRLASQIISLELAGQTREEARETLLERQRDRLHRAGQVHGQDVFQLFMSALTASYDPHTQYMVPRRAENFDMRMSLSLEGIGALLRPDPEYAWVERLIPAGPAERGGELQAGDRIVAVAQGKDGEFVDIQGWRLDDSVQLIRGPRDSIVRLSVLQADAPESAPPQTIVITRDEVKLEDQAATSEIIDVPGADGSTLRMGIVDLPTFYEDMQAFQRGEQDYKSSTRDVAHLLMELKEEAVDGVILDLRGNGGGSLHEAYELSGLFLERRPVVQVRRGDGQLQLYKGAGRPVWTGPLLVLVDRLSASASEIFAAAVQDHGRGPIVGQRTFGKGTVQAVQPSADGRLLVTIAKFYRVTGESTQHAGVTPDISFPELYDPDEVGESAMEEALPWDQIAAVRSLQKGNAPATWLPPLLPEFRTRHEQRIASDPDFILLQRELVLRREARAETTVSLNLETRREEQERDNADREQILADWRLAKGHAVEPESDSAEDGDPPRPPSRMDAWLLEAQHILADLVELRRG
jgi:carboxyl-terminal processing protease